MMKIPFISNINIKSIKKKTVESAVNTAKSTAISTKKASRDIKTAKRMSFKNKKGEKIVSELQEFLAPNGYKPLSLNHYELNDNGKMFYGRSFYVREFPKRGKFVELFKELFQFKNCNTVIYIDPISSSQAIKSLDDDLTTIEAEIMSASKEVDTNRQRKLQNKYSDAEYFQTTLEGRENKLLNVAFIFTLQEESLDALDRASSEFAYKAKDSGIELSSFYANQEVAFKMNKPFNNPRVLSATQNFLIGVKWHPLDLYSLSTIFAHTATDFYHENGLVIGRNLLTGLNPVAYDIVDPSHSNQNVFFTGTSGYGKSSTIKKLIRLYSLVKGQKFAILDAENVFGRGEYSDIVDALGGYRFELSSKSTNKLNPFEIRDEVLYRKETDTYQHTLSLIDKVPYIANTILSLISVEGQSHSNIMIRIVNEITLQLFLNIGLKEGDPESLYEISNSMVSGKLLSVKQRKTLPRLRDFVILAIKRKLENREPLYHVEYVNLIAGLSTYVEELNICEHGCGHVLEENVNICPKCNEKMSQIKGSFAIFDGQTSSEKDINFENFPILSIDVSNVPKAYLPKAQMIGLNYLLEGVIKSNSENPQKAERITLVNDEQHKTFRDKENRETLIEAVRIIRKKNAGLWSITQSINDYTLYDEAKAIITQSDTAFVFRHKGADRNSLMNLLDGVNQSDIQFTINAQKGQLLLVDVSGKARVQIDLLKTELDFANTNMELAKKKKEAENEKKTT